jgi:osmotically-inducible protein OsmY
MVEDLALEWAVRSALRREARTADIAITVQGDGGVVRLLGVVDSQVQSDAAAEVARAVEGAASVDNQLRSAGATGSRYRREG